MKDLAKTWWPVPVLLLGGWGLTQLGEPWDLAGVAAVIAGMGLGFVKVLALAGIKRK